MINEFSTKEEVIEAVNRILAEIANLWIQHMENSQ